MNTNSIDMADGRCLMVDSSQARCITGLSAHMCVVGKPGSGKTSTIVAKCAFHISSGVRPSSIIVITLTHQAAIAIKTSLVKLVGSRAHQLWCGTLNGLALKMIRKYAPKLNTPLNTTTINDTVLSTQLHSNLLVFINTKCAELAMSRVHNKFNKCYLNSDFDILHYEWLHFLNSSSLEADRLHADIQYCIIDDAHEYTAPVTLEIMHAFARHGTHIVIMGNNNCYTGVMHSKNAGKGLTEYVQTPECYLMERFDQLFEGGELYTLEYNHRNSLEIDLFCNAVIQYNFYNVPNFMAKTCAFLPCNAPSDTPTHNATSDAPICNAPSDTLPRNASSDAHSDTAPRNALSDTPATHNASSDTPATRNTSSDTATHNASSDTPPRNALSDTPPRNALSNTNTSIGLRVCCFPTFEKEVRFIIDLLHTDEKSSVAILTRNFKECELLTQALNRNHIVYYELLREQDCGVGRFFKKPHIQVVLNFLNVCLTKLPSKHVVSGLMQVLSKGDTTSTVHAIWDSVTKEMTTLQTRGQHYSFIERFLVIDPANLSDGMVQIQLELAQIRHVLIAIHTATCNNVYVAYYDYIVSITRSTLLPRLYYAYRKQHTEFELLRDVERVFSLLSRFHTYNDFVISIALGECNMGDSDPLGQTYNWGLPVRNTRTNNPNCRVSIGTITGAIGLEFDRVIIAGCCEGSIPAAVNIPANKDKDATTPPIDVAETMEMERRLFYLACSRACSSLVLTYSERGGPWPMSPLTTTRRLTHFVLPCEDYHVADSVHNLFCKYTALHGFTPRVHKADKTDKTNILVLSVSACMDQLITVFGKTNILFTTLEKKLKFNRVSCELMAAPVLPPTFILVQKDMEHMLQHIVSKCMTENAGWKNVVHAVIADQKSHWKMRLAAKHILKVRLLKTGSKLTPPFDPVSACAPCTWPKFLDSLQRVCEQLFNGLNTPVRLCSGKSGFLILDHSIMVTTFSDTSISGADLADMLLHATNNSIPITILVELNCNRGHLLTVSKFHAM